jgi:predicted lipid-binding transport protein (Tim44 family)
MTSDAHHDEYPQPPIHGQHWMGALVLAALMGLICTSVLVGPAGLAGLLVLGVLVICAAVPDLFSRR